MRLTPRLGVALAGALLFGFAAPAEARALAIAPGAVKPGLKASQADVVVLGKVVEVEKDPVEATPYKGAPKDQKVSYKVAVVKVEEALIGGKGLTQFRVGFPAEAPAAGAEPTPPVPPGGPVPAVRPIRRGFGPVGLAAGMEGCFFLARHHEGDFYVLANNGTAAPLLKKADAYAKELEEVKKTAKTLEDPVAALKAKELDDRFQAAYTLLQRYQMNTGGATAREPIPDEENKLILKLLAELPWQADNSKPRTGSDPVPPSRAALWGMIVPIDSGFKQPTIQPVKPGDPPVDYNKVMDEATSAFLKSNGDKIKIKRWAK